MSILAYRVVHIRDGTSRFFAPDKLEEAKRHMMKVLRDDGDFQANGWDDVRMEEIKNGEDEQTCKVKFTSNDLVTHESDKRVLYILDKENAEKLEANKDIVATCVNVIHPEWMEEIVFDNP